MGKGEMLFKSALFSSLKLPLSEVTFSFITLNSGIIMLTFVHGYRIYECPFFCRLLYCDCSAVSESCLRIDHIAKIINFPDFGEGKPH